MSVTQPVSKFTTCRLELGSATAPEEIEQKLSKPLAAPEVEEAFAESLREWKAYKRPAPIPGKAFADLTVLWDPYIH